MMDYGKIISNRAAGIKPSGIRKFFDLIDNNSNMADVISLGVGQPDFMTPWHIRRAGIKSLEDGKTFYTANAGLIDLRNEISGYMKRRFDLDYSSKQVVVTVGGSEAIDLVLRSFLNPGDEVIIPEPCFVCYTPITELCSGVPVSICTKEENNFKLTAEELEAAITPKTKVLILPFPNNPTGAIMTKEDLEKIAEVLRGKDIIVLADEIYAELTYGGLKHTSIASLPEMYERTIVVNGFSKAYAMTGWRLGFACGPKELISVMTKIHQFAIMSAPTTAQFAGIDALRNGDSDIEYMVGEYETRRRLVYNEFQRIGLDCFEPLGAFYFFPSVKKFGLTSEEFCARLLNEGRVAAIPGSAFGECGEGNMRVSYAYSTKNLLAAIERIEAFIKTL